MKNVSSLPRAGVQALGMLRHMRADSALLSISGVFEPSKTVSVAIVVSKAVSKRAADRNLLRRRIRHALLDISPEYSGRFIIRVKKPALREPYARIRDDLSTLFVELFARYNAST